MLIAISIVLLARKRGWLVPGYHIPEYSSGDRVLPNVVMALSTKPGRDEAKRQILGRDGWWFAFDALWTRCGICGKPVLVSVSNIDHIIPRSEGGSDRLGNLQLTHPECNVWKGSLLPSLLQAMQELENDAKLL